MSWIAGWNMPGCLPETAPETLNTWSDARDYLIGELSLVVENDDPDLPPSRETTQASKAIRELDRVVVNTSWAATVGYYNYWMEPADSRTICEISPQRS